MPNIVIKEIDETSAGVQAASTDVAYVPGFADTNSAVYIYTTAIVYDGTAITEGGPTTSTKGVVAQPSYTYNSHLQYPCFACNILEKKCWQCVAVNDNTYTWELLETYVAPSPENIPVLCSTIDEFEANFGKVAYQWKMGYKADGTLETSAETLARAQYPAFAQNAFPSSVNYAYSLNDYEKSYIYAKELINLGVPVIFENVVSRDGENDNRKELPSVNYLYKQLVGCYDELLDKGEYTVKYITSGPYPTFEYSGQTTVVTDYSAIGEFPYSSTETLTEPINVATVDAVNGPFAPTSLVVTLTYVPTGESEAVTATINVDSDGYTETGATAWGGVGNTITLTSTGFAVTLNANWTWTSATYTASRTDTTTTYGASIAQKMVSVASARGDSVAIIDHTNNPVRALTGASSVYESVKATNITDAEFATMFTPWATYTTVAEGINVPSNQVMPASFGYLLSLAKSIRTNANWFAIAGVSRGLVPYIQELNTVQRLSNTIANSYQPRDDVSINAITNIKPYGLTIWGNRTLKDNVSNLVATSFLNIRNLVSDVKKVAYTTAKSLIFEQNSDVLWVNFKAGITPLLDQMLSGQGITGYKIIKGTTTEKAKVVADIKIYPIEAVEDFEINVIISDDTVTVS